MQGQKLGILLQQAVLDWDTFLEEFIALPVFAFNCSSKLQGKLRKGLLYDVLKREFISEHISYCVLFVLGAQYILLHLAQSRVGSSKPRN